MVDVLSGIYKSGLELINNGEGNGFIFMVSLMILLNIIMFLGAWKVYRMYKEGDVFLD